MKQTLKLPVIRKTLMLIWLNSNDINGYDFNVYGRNLAITFDKPLDNDLPVYQNPTFGNKDRLIGLIH